MRATKFLVFLWLAMLTSAVCAGEFDEANQLYDAGKFGEAKQAYEKLAGRGVSSGTFDNTKAK